MKEHLANQMGNMGRQQERERKKERKTGVLCDVMNPVYRKKG